MVPCCVVMLGWRSQRIMQGVCRPWLKPKLILCRQHARMVARRPQQYGTVPRGQADGAKQAAPAMQAGKARREQSNHTSKCVSPPHEQGSGTRGLILADTSACLTPLPADPLRRRHALGVRTRARLRHPHTYRLHWRW